MFIPRQGANRYEYFYKEKMRGNSEAQWEIDYYSLNSENEKFKSYELTDCNLKVGFHISKFVKEGLVSRGRKRHLYVVISVARIVPQAPKNPSNSSISTRTQKTTTSNTVYNTV